MECSELPFCELCNIQLKDKKDYVCSTCFEILMEECFPTKEEPEKKKRKRT